MHFDDPFLLAFSDGELGFVKYARVRTHLAFCPSCRDRLTELESQSRLIARVLAAPTLTKGMVEAAKSRFLDSLEERHIPFQPSEDGARTPVRRLGAGGRLGFGAILLACASAFALWRAVRPPVKLAPPRTAVGSTGRAIPKAAPVTASAIVSPAIPSASPPPPSERGATEIAERVPVNVDNDALEMRLLFALHQAGSCLGEQVELSRNASDGFLIHGIVESVQRRKEIVGRLAEAAGPESVRTDILTVEESAGTAFNPEELRPPDRPEPPSRPARSDSGELVRFLESQNRRETATELQRRVSEVSNAAVKAMNAALADAWALRHLGERFPPRESDRLSSESKVLLARMVRDHLNGLRKSVTGVIGLLESEGTDGGGQLSDREATNSSEWNAMAQAVLDGTREAHGSALLLFASATSAEPGTPDRLPQFRSDLKDLLALISRCSQQDLSTKKDP